jgi:general secretion pathway protein J
MSARRRGFTLVEVMVALFVMAIMAGLAWRGIDGIARARAIGKERLQQTLRLDTVMTQWRQDIEGIYNTGGFPPAMQFDGATLRLTRKTENGVQVVAWSLRNGEWLRWTGPEVTRRDQLADSWMRSQQLQGTEAGTLHVLQGVAAWQVYYCRQHQCWSNAQSTGDVANAGGPANPANPNAQATQTLPGGIRIVLTFAGAPLQGTLTRDLEVPGGT